MSGIFISYRRDDTQGFAGRLAHDLSCTLGPDRVFSDIEIPPGSDFGDVLHRAIAASDALLVVIGRRWAAAAGDGRRARLFDADDWVRTEIEAALSQGKAIIPVLVGGATMPPPTALPETIRQLTHIQAASFEDRHWATDLAALVARLRALVPELGEAALQAGKPPTPRSANESLAQVLQELARRVIEESRERAAERMPSRPDGALRRTARALLRSVGHALGRVIKVGLFVAMIYMAARLFGDDSVLRILDALESQLAMAWERLLR